MRNRIAASAASNNQNEPQFHIVGAWDRGGLLHVDSGELKIEVRLPRLLFAVMVVLLEARKNSPSRNDSRGYLKPSDICHRMNSHKVYTDLDRIVPLVCRLRKRLAQAYGSGHEGETWAKQLVETFPPLGYGISVSPEHITIEFIDYCPPEVAAGGARPWVWEP